MVEIPMPSGAILTVALSPFEEAKSLFQKTILFQIAVKELNSIDFKAMNPEDMETEMVRKVFVSALSSPEVEKAIWKCFGRCLYNGLKITETTFEKPELWGDYTMACLEVGKANFLPFVKSLYSGFLTK